MLERAARSLARYHRMLATESRVRLRLFNRVEPISHTFGMARGQPIDRYYIEKFVAGHARDIRGRVLEAGGYRCYAKMFGGAAVSRVDVMYPIPGEPGGTLVGNLETGEGIESGAYDCLVMTQVYTCIYDLKAAVRHSRQALKPGGVLLATLAGNGQLPLPDRERWGVYWRFTDDSARRLFGDEFGPENVEVETFGNVLAICSQLECLSSGDLSREELEHNDPQYQLTVAVRAANPG
jgi:hypothetical protein